MIPEKLVEFRTLLEAISIVVNESHRVADRQSSFSQLDRCDLERLVKLAVAHGLVAWLDEASRLAIVQDDSSQLMQLSVLLKDTSRVIEFQSIQQSKKAVKVSAMLKDAGIDHVVFKGLGAQQQFYTGFVTSRLSDDLDLLVAPKSLPAAVKVLLDRGYNSCKGLDVKLIAQFVERHSSLYRWRDLGISNNESLLHTIDLHWRIADHFTYPADVDHLIESRSVESTEYGSFPCLNFSEHFVYVCVHGYSDYFFRLRHLVDVYAGTKQADFDLVAIMAIAKFNGVEQVVRDSIELANALFCVQKSEQFSSSKFTETVVAHFVVNEGWPKRLHPNKGHWRLRDKYEHLRRQIENRSSVSNWVAPFKARLLLGAQDLNGWDGSQRRVGRLFLRSYLRRLTSFAGF